MSKNPQEITVIVEGERIPVENVEGWFYDGLDLVVTHFDEENSRYPNGNVID